jgi:transcriptional regulator with PAS, ATPase and Fis domain
MNVSENNKPADSKQTEKQTLQLRLSNELMTKLQGLLESESFYQEVLNVIQSNLHYYSIQFWTVEPSPNESLRPAILRAQAGAYDHHLEIGHVLKATTSSIVHKVIRDRHSYLASDVSKDQYFTNLSFPVQTRSEVCIPIIKNDLVIATLNVESDIVNAFDAEDIITLEAIASQIAVAISNHTLFTEQKTFNDKLQKAVADKTRELQEAQDRILQQQRMLERENKVLKNLVKQDKSVIDIIGESPAIHSILGMVEKIAPTTATVLIQGESGTGKELIAKQLHYKSARANGPYTTINCGALQESLLESELFGHEKGAFTGAVTQKLGLAEASDGGTLFLDEIGEVALPIQAKLLRFLQEGEFYRIGGKKPIKVNVRIISATNRDLETEVKENRFREDLFYRLNTITLRMPPLRKRKEDIPMLVDYFLKNSRFGMTDGRPFKIDSRVIEAFQNYDWPGNIRELQNTIERLVILAENFEIKVEDIPFNIRAPKPSTRMGGDLYSPDTPLEEVEKTHILKALTFHHGNKTRAAQALGITIKTLYNKLHKYGVIESHDPRSQEGQ